MSSDRPRRHDDPLAVQERCPATRLDSTLGQPQVLVWQALPGVPFTCPRVARTSATGRVDGATTLSDTRWHHGGTVVAPWWHRGGTMVAPSALWWHHRGTIMAP